MKVRTRLRSQWPSVALRLQAGRHISSRSSFVSVRWWCGHHDDLAARSGGCASAIAVIAERLLLPKAPPPIARGFSGQLPERRGEGGLGSITKRGGDRHDRRVGVAQHVHGLLESVLAQPGMRRKPGAFLE